MLVRPTDKWINSVVVPDLGIVSRPRAGTTAEVSDATGDWLIEAGFATDANISENPAKESEQLSPPDRPPTDVPPTNLPPADPPVSEPIKPKKLGSKTPAPNSEKEI